MSKRQKEMEKTSATVLAAEKAAVLKVLQELDYGPKATTLTSAVLMKFGERNAQTLFPGSMVLGKKSYGDVYAAFKGLYTLKSEISWNTANNRVNSRAAAITKTVGSYTRYLSPEQSRHDEADTEDDEPPLTSQTTTKTPMTRWGKHYVMAPAESDEDEDGSDTQDDE